jgi:hypothetical protein
MSKHVLTIEAGDIGHGILRRTIPACSCCGRPEQTRTFSLCDTIGHVLPMDVGKRVYEVSPGLFQVENQEQLGARLRREQGS